MNKRHGECCECYARRVETVEMGYQTRTTNVCANCLRKALSMLEPTSGGVVGDGFGPSVIGGGGGGRTEFFHVAGGASRSEERVVQLRGGAGAVSSEIVPVGGMGGRGEVRVERLDGESGGASGLDAITGGCAGGGWRLDPPRVPGESGLAMHETWTPNPPTEPGPHWVLHFGAEEPLIAYFAVVSDGLRAFTREGDRLPFDEIALFGPKLVPPPLPGQAQNIDVGIMRGGASAKDSP